MRDDRAAGINLPRARPAARLDGVTGRGAVGVAGGALAGTMDMPFAVVASMLADLGYTQADFEDYANETIYAGIEL